jgi:hypothetical protein
VVEKHNTLRHFRDIVVGISYFYSHVCFSLRLLSSVFGVKVLCLLCAGIRVWCFVRVPFRCFILEGDMSMGKRLLTRLANV